MHFNMNETLKTIMTRRSIRSFKPEQITDHEIQTILDAAMYAPNAMNQQKWHFTVIQNRGLLDRMVKVIKESIRNSGNEFLIKRAGDPNYNTFYNAPTVILISADEKAPYVQLDCGLSAQNITLAAEALNIGSCVIASSSLLFLSEVGKGFLKELGVPDGYNHVCTIALGYKNDENPVAPPRNKDVINYVR